MRTRKESKNTGPVSAEGGAPADWPAQESTAIFHNTGKKCQQMTTFAAKCLNLFTIFKEQKFVEALNVNGCQRFGPFLRGYRGVSSGFLKAGVNSLTPP